MLQVKRVHCEYSIRPLIQEAALRLQWLQPLEGILTISIWSSSRKKRTHDMESRNHTAKRDARNRAEVGGPNLPQKILDRNTKWEKVDFPFQTESWQLPLTNTHMKKDLTDVIYWARQLLGLLCGLVWGLIPLHGYVGNLG